MEVSSEATYWEVRFKKHGVRILYATDESVNDDTLAGRLTKKIKQELATEESRKQSLRVRERSKLRSKEGYRVGGFAPYGYKRRLVNSDGTLDHVLEHGARKHEKSQRVILVPGDPIEVQTVRDIFDARVAGKSLVSICRELNSRGILPPSRTRPGFERFASCNWNANTIQKICSNSVYRGDLSYNRSARGSWVKHENPQLRWRSETDVVVSHAAHESIIEPDVFDEVQLMRRNRRRNGIPKQRRTESPYLLTGFVVCHQCGKRFYGHSRNSRGSTSHPYYESSCSRSVVDESCTRGMVPKHDLESFVIKHTSETIMRKVNRKRLRDMILQRLERPSESTTTEIRQTKKALGEIQRRVDNCYVAIERGHDPDDVLPRIGNLKEQAKVLSERQQAVSHELKLSRNPDVVVDKVMSQLDDIQKVLAQAAPPAVKKALPSLLDRIEVDSSHRTASCYFYKTPQINMLDSSVVG